MVDGKTLFYSLVLFVFCVVLPLCSIGINYSDPHWETITVTEKTVGIGQSRSYLIYSTYSVYEIQDLYLVGFVTSSDVYSSIKPGETYRVKVMGKRIPFLSAYKNIVEVKHSKNGIKK